MQTLARKAAFAAADSLRSDSNFGTVIANEGDMFVIGAPFDREKGHRAGAFYAFKKTASGFTQLAKHTAPDGHDWTQLGAAVALQGNTLAVGAPGAGPNGIINGGVYIYTRSGDNWTLQSTLFAPDGDPRETLFGRSVSLDGNTLLVGRSGDNSHGGQSGKAYIYERDGTEWKLKHTILADQPRTLSYFGHAVALHGDTAIISAFQERVGTYSTVGAVYIFTKNAGQWKQSARLAPPTDSPCNFGERIAFDGTTLVVGAPQTNGYTGATHIYVRDASGKWVSQANLATPEDPSRGSNSQYGASLALAGDTVIVGAPQTTDHRNKRVGAGFLYVRKDNQWSLAANLDPHVDGRGAGLGLAVAGDSILCANTSENGEAIIGLYPGGQFLTPSVPAPTLVRMGQTPASPGGVMDSNFGAAMATAGNIVAIGAPFDPAMGHKSGAVFVFEKTPDGLVQQAKLIPPNGHEWGQFGTSVALSGKWLAVGSPGGGHDGGNNGVVYLYIHRGHLWCLHGWRLPPGSDKKESDFGSSVAFDGDTLLVGHSGDNSGGSQSGAAYIYSHEGSKWPRQAMLVPETPIAQARFGHSAALSGNIAAVGAPFESNDKAKSAGAVYVFEKKDGAWKQTARLLPPENVPCNFGERIALDGDTLIVGAPQTNGYTGAAHVFVRNAAGAWVAQGRLDPEEAAANSQYGLGVAIRGDLAVVGAPQTTDHRNIRTGAIHAFRRSSGQWSKATRAEAGEVRGLGASVGITETVIFATQTATDGTGTAGEVALYRTE